MWSTLPARSGAPCAMAPPTCDHDNRSLRRHSQVHRTRRLGSAGCIVPGCSTVCAWRRWRGARNIRQRCYWLQEVVLKGSVSGESQGRQPLQGGLDVKYAIGISPALCPQAASACNDTFAEL